MKILNAEFKAGAAKPEQIHRFNLPEIAFAGRSNVGKSSLLNSLVLRKNLAKISSSPGKTKQINFFSVNDAFCLADLPGYGFASVSKQSREDWKNLCFNYIENRKYLKLTCVLIDSRHDPMPIDLGFIEWLEEHQKRYIVILTKTDKIAKNILDKRLNQFKFILSECRFLTELLPYSSITGTGRNQLIAIINKMCNIRD